jgi:hypothetical protein
LGSILLGGLLGCILGCLRLRNLLWRIWSRVLRLLGWVQGRVLGPPGLPLPGLARGLLFWVLAGLLLGLLEGILLSWRRQLV